jgi:hypothetical protein
MKLAALVLSLFLFAGCAAVPSVPTNVSRVSDKCLSTQVFERVVKDQVPDAKIHERLVGNAAQIFVNKTTGITTVRVDEVLIFVANSAHPNILVGAFYAGCYVGHYELHIEAYGNQRSNYVLMGEGRVRA